MVDVEAHHTARPVAPIPEKPRPLRKFACGGTAYLGDDMDVLAWFDEMKAQVTKVIEKEGLPALAKFDAMATEVIRQAKEVQRRTEALAAEAAQAASGAARNIVVKAAVAKGAAQIVDAVIEDDDEDEPEDEEGEE